MFSQRTRFVVCLLLMFGFARFEEIKNDNLAVRVYVALDGVLRFICDNMDDMNVDGMFGVVLAQAHLRSIPPLFDKPRFEYLINFTANLINRFKSQHSNASSRNDIFQKYLLNVDLWLKEINFALGRLYNEEEDISETCPEYYDALNNVHFSEELSDECLLTVIDQSVNEDRLCSLNDVCNDFINDDRYIPGYGITHKLLLVQTMRALKCKWDLRWINKRITDFCSNILRETIKIEKCGYITTLDDLFIEQVVLCGFEGYEEFFPTKWIEHVLKIQTPQGCFGTFTSASVFEKREANLIKHNCIDHTTGLGAAVLSLYLRYLTVTGKGGTFAIIERYEDDA